ncbi:MAG: OmpA family protein [Spirochaetales bacterium]|nr:OmpA family protein [Spirochaetales bacterium]
MQNTFYRFSLIMFITLFFVACATTPETVDEPEPTAEPQVSIAEEPEVPQQEPEVVEPEPEPTPEPEVEPVDERAALRAEVEELVRRLNASDNVTVVVIPEGVDIMITRAFDPNSAAIAGQLVDYLDLIGAILTLVEVESLVVEGHVADVGDPADNGPISEERAANTASYLRENFEISPDTITTVGRGGTDPIASNTTAQGRSRNRRVVLLVRGTV